ncbi:hypothetical protein [Rhizobium sp. N122]|uniref:hypothetical protein n=1 Tax=Rhizobium sp. N122 TaxID=1764272 RepID=UPI0032AFD0EE
MHQEHAQLFETYGRDHAALCSTVIRYRSKGAERDVGKALGPCSETQDSPFPADQAAAVLGRATPSPPRSSRTHNNPRRTSRG